MDYYAGIDVSLEQRSLCIVDTGATRPSHRRANDRRTAGPWKLVETGGSAPSIGNRSIPSYSPSSLCNHDRITKD
jgi:hypothetical protein